MDDKARETITKYLGDMHALTSHGRESINRQVNNLEGTEHHDAHAMVREFRTTLDRHISALEQRMHAMGGSPTSPVKDAASAVAGVAAGLYNKVRNEEASKSVRDDYTFLSHCAIGYLMLHTTAMSMGDTETAQLAERHYRDAAHMVMWIDRVIPQLVIEELRQDGMSVRDVSDDCRRMVHEAWNRDSMSNLGMTGGMGTSTAR